MMKSILMLLVNPSMVLSAVRSKAVVLFLLTCCLLLLQLWESVIVKVAKVEERAGCFAWFVFLVSLDCCAALPRGAIGLFVVCDCGIFSSYLVTISVCLQLL